MYRVAARADVAPDSLADRLESLQFLLSESFRSLLADAATTSGHSMPDRLRLFGRTDPLAASVVVTITAFKPAVSLHTAKNAGQRRRLDAHSLGEIGLSQFPFERKPIQNFPLSKRDLFAREFRFEGAANRMRCRRKPIADAVLVIVFQHSQSPYRRSRLRQRTLSTCECEGKP